MQDGELGHFAEVAGEIGRLVPTAHEVYRTMKHAGYEGNWDNGLQSCGHGVTVSAIEQDHSVDAIGPSACEVETDLDTHTPSRSDYAGDALGIEDAHRIVRVVLDGEHAQG